MVFPMGVMSADVSIASMKILIVDDHALMREGLGQLLAGMYPDLALLHAANGAQAIDMLLPHRDIDLVLLDYQLPDMTGLDVMRHVAKIQPGLAVLVISGSVNPPLMQQTLSAGACGFVQKTGNAQALVQAHAARSAAIHHRIEQEFGTDRLDQLLRLLQELRALDLRDRP